MKIVSVLVNVEVTCPECGGIALRLNKATLTEDGRVSEPLPMQERDCVCTACLLAMRGDDGRSQRQIKRAQRQWADGRPTHPGLVGSSE